MIEWQRSCCVSREPGELENLTAEGYGAAVLMVDPI